ncbi:MAG: hypothetical protein ACRD0Y_13070 [Terriglobales bacterium]
MLQIEPVRWRATLAGRGAIVSQHLNGQRSLSYGPHELGRFTAQGLPIRPAGKPPAQPNDVLAT